MVLFPIMRIEVEGLYSRAFPLLDRAELEHSKQILEKERGRLNASTIRIAILGDFKVGKTAVVNAAFLGESLLFSNVIEATAVPTELAYGEEKRMLIFPRIQKKESITLDLGDPKKLISGELNLTSGIGAPEIVINPSPEHLQNETSGSNDEERTRKAKATVKVRLEWPNPWLIGRELVDTPGLNSSNTAVAEATMSLLHNIDFAVLIVAKGQLSMTEIQTLESGILKEGIARLVCRLIFLYTKYQNVLTFGYGTSNQSTFCYDATVRGIEPNCQSIHCEPASCSPLSHHPFACRGTQPGRDFPTGGSQSPGRCPLGETV